MPLYACGEARLMSAGYGFWFLMILILIMGYQQYSDIGGM
jgi:hypothetical protein